MDAHFMKLYSDESNDVEFNKAFLKIDSVIKRMKQSNFQQIINLSHDASRYLAEAFMFLSIDDKRRELLDGKINEMLLIGAKKYHKEQEIKEYYNILIKQSDNAPSWIDNTINKLKAEKLQSKLGGDIESVNDYKHVISILKLWSFPKKSRRE